ncbi:C6 zinc finger domain-containing protein [Ophiobolus disseminans]|uniref:C6 zinc finger domain-containing protein n=1 Tax=Ophiobolus disseminans TaxID=1469910 RepID=A0A6A6ZFQ8_9PLEO|nr:C6 zinc finger domain-containing protein [Ophiobolus disseminans]
MSNGYNQSISPPHPNNAPYHPPPPQSAQQYGEGVPYAPSPYMGQYSGPNNAMRRKQVRATQACNHCRARKQKCDEARPCQFCRENSFDCQYKDVPPPKQDRSMMQLQDSMNNISDVLKDFIGEIGAWRQDVESRLPPSRAFGNTPNVASPDAAFAPPPRDPSASRVPTPAQGRNQPRRVVSNLKMESPMYPYPNMSPVTAQVSTPIKQESMMAASQQPATPADSVRTDTSRTSNIGPKERIGLQSDHTTPAHKLFEEWGLMDTFPNGVEYLQRLKSNGQALSDYPMQLEQDRGLLRVWGYGEGADLNDGAQGPGSPESSNDSDAPSPAPGKEGLWGHPPVDHSSPHPMSGSTPRDHYNPDHSVGGLGQDGRPNFLSAMVDRLHMSYMEHMHSLHPFLNPSKLQRMIREFKEQYSPDGRAANAASPAAHQLNPSLKRKRSTSAFGEPYSPRGAIERSLRNAIVLLVLALGKVCSYKEQLPSPQSDKGPHSNGGTWGSFSSFPHSSFHSDVSDENRPRNIDMLPGMAYFSYATDIIGNQQGGHTVGHAQAMILAALYIGQFARVLESWSWIHSACRVTMVLIKQDYNKLHREFHVSGEAKRVLSPKERYRLELVMLVYWTCVQLESDIVAEMSTLPTSSVTMHQNHIMYPAGVYDHFPVDGKELAASIPERKRPEDDKDIMIYSSQIWMRVILNEAHNALYGASGNKSFDQSNIRAVADHATSHKDILESWRRVLPQFLAWKDGDPPATDLNIARLRAKYYGGLYMMLRPYLRIATHVIEYPPSHQSANRQAHWSHHNSPAATGEASTPSSRQMVDLSETQEKIVEVACQCIESAIQSTIAFDRVGAPDDSPYEDYRSTRTTRLVLTNIFGTLHAQFGNMLVLAAVYKSKLYPHLPPNTSLTPKNLHALFERTFQVLEQVAPNSPVLRVDLDILNNVRSQLDGLPPRIPRP